MSNEEFDDLDDKLFIVLAAMKEQGKNLEKYQNIIESDRERLEQLYSRLGSDISGIAEKSLQSQFKGVVGALNNQTVKLNQATNNLDWRFMLLYASAFVGAILVFFLMAFMFVPSLDEIQERRAEVASLKQQYSLDISRCGGKTCVKVMTKECGYGKNKDYCVIDPR